MTMRLRVPLSVRLAFVLFAVTGVSTILALAFHERSLAHDLERAARRRLEAAARAADRLVDLHVRATGERYRAIAGTPQFRATLEVQDPPTLAHYAAEIARTQGAGRILFLDADAKPIVGTGDVRLDPPAPGTVDGASFSVRNGHPFALIGLPLETAGRTLGHLVAIEPVSRQVVREWSRLCGAKVIFRPGPPNPTTLRMPLPDHRDLGVHVRISMAAERRALANARRRLLAAGAVGLWVALLIGVLWSRRLARAVRLITGATERIGHGDFTGRITSPRRDEIGDVARAVDAMAARLAHAREAELESERLKSEFLANVSHEMRTPMHGIFGMTEMLLDGPLTGEQRDCGERVRRCAENLLRMIDDLLDLSKIEAGKLTLDDAEFDVEGLVDDAIDVVARPAAAKQLELLCVVEGDVPSVLRGDAGRLRQVLINLLGNAVKFTDCGEVVLRVGLVRRTGDHATLRFQVRDTGIGIAQNAMHHLFQSFTQIDGSMTRQHGGTGLGLAIAKQLVELMGGDIGVQSEAGKGSTFWFTASLPCPDGVPTVGTQGLAPHSTTAPVLVVGDHDTARTLLSEQLYAWGMRGVVTARTSDVPVVLRDALASGHYYRVVVLDVHAPQRDLALLETIQRELGWGHAAAVILVPLGYREENPPPLTGSVVAQLTRPWRLARLRSTLAATIAAVQAAA